MILLPSCVCCGGTPCSGLGACCEKSGSSYTCSQKISCDCDDLDGRFFGEGSSCSPSPCGSTQGFFCCGSCTFPASYNLTLNATVTDAVMTNTFMPGTTVNDYQHKTDLSLSATVTLTKNAAECPTYSFSNNCGTYDDFNVLSATLKRLQNLCRWEFSFNATAERCLFGFSQNLEVPPWGKKSACDDLPYLFYSITGLQVLTTNKCSPTSLSFSGTYSDTSFACGPVRNCWKVADDCTITSGTIAATTATIDWSASFS